MELVLVLGLIVVGFFIYRHMNTTPEERELSKRVFQEMLRVNEGINLSTKDRIEQHKRIAQEMRQGVYKTPEEKHAEFLANVERSCRQAVRAG